MSKVSLPSDDNEPKKARPVNYTGIALPPDTLILSEVMKACSENRASRDEFALLLSQDPVLTFDILKDANAIGEKRVNDAGSATLQSSLIRLGSTKTLECLTTSGDKPHSLSKDGVRCFEVHRSRGKRIGLISRMIATSIARSLADEAQVSGLFVSLGDMIITVHLGDEYIPLFDGADTRAALHYALSHEHKLDDEKIGTLYLSKNGIPELLSAPLVREKTGKSKEFTTLRLIVTSAAELVDHFDSNRWDKLAPGKTLPSTSPIRLLNFSDESIYKKLYERASEYLFTVRTSDLTRQAMLSRATGSTSNELIQSLLGLSTHTDTSKNPDTLGSSTVSPLVKEVVAESTPSHSEILKEKFDLSRSSDGDRKERPLSSDSHVPQHHEIKLTTAQKTVVEITESLSTVHSSEELIGSLLQILVEKGPFKKTALIVVSRDRKDAIVVASRGPIPKSGVRFSLDDPLSPLALCLSKVQSFGAVESKSSPFGSKTYALAPIEAQHDTPVALYADCGNDGSITFEARRIFRIVVDIANDKLKSLPGGIPVEFDV
jgi:HD-like signal output (HDOD) protein